MSLVLPRPPQQYSNQWANDLAQRIEQYARQRDQPAGVGYTVTFTESRTLDASTATTAEVADFVCTLVDDLIKKNVIAK